MHYKLVSYKEVAARLKVARLEKGWTGVQAAEAAQMAQPEVSRIENGKERFFTAAMQAKTERLAKALGVGDLRWEPADDDEMIREEARELTEEVMTDEQRDRKARIASYFKRPTRTFADEILLMLDLHGAGMIGEQEVLSNVEHLAVLAKSQEVTTVGELGRVGALNTYVRQFGS